MVLLGHESALRQFRQVQPLRQGQLPRRGSNPQALGCLCFRSGGFRCPGGEIWVLGVGL